MLDDELKGSHMAHNRCWFRLSKFCVRFHSNVPSNLSINLWYWCKLQDLLLPVDRSPITKYFFMEILINNYLRWATVVKCWPFGLSIKLTASPNIPWVLIVEVAGTTHVYQIPNGNVLFSIALDIVIIHIGSNLCGWNINFLRVDWSIGRLKMNQKQHGIPFSMYT